ncbi:MAG: BON domain-containing protein [Bacteroidota bacterium]|nr:BON domain-containing protein [Bacteroidota bacterium]
MRTDAEIQKDVMEELKWEPFLNVSEIGVAVKQGVVTLSGTVDTYSKKETAEKATKRVKGVKAIAEDIEVKPFSSFIKNDTEIARIIADSLKWHSAVQEEKIKVKVESGWVTLDGEVDWEYQKDAAKNAIKNLPSVKGITNLIAVKPTITPKDIQQKISLAFHRSATLDSQKINVDINGNKAILSGTVRSWAAKTDAENAAWKAAGITKVENKLVVDSEVFAF